MSIRTRNLIALGAVALSCFFNLLTFPLGFLILPAFVFPPVAFFCGAVACLAVQGSRPGRTIFLKALVSLSMAASVSVFIFWLRLLSKESWH